MKIKNFKAIPLIFFKGDIGLGQAYALGYVEIDDVSLYLEKLLKNGNIKKGLLKSILGKIHKFFKNNTITQAKKNISSHYDLGNNFYKQWLDSSMTYSSALFLKEEDTLESAQINKYRRVIDQLNLKSQHVLEIGCGWGGFIQQLMKDTDCTITAITISEEQYKYCKHKIIENNWDHRVDLQLKDYRDIEGQFDKIVSIEMVEALGYEYWDVFFTKVRSLLNPKGQCLIQSITLNLNSFEKYANSTDFIRTYIFPGGCLVQLDYLLSKTGLNVIGSLEFTTSYIKTLQIWLDVFLSQREQLKKDHSEFFLKIWQFYLEYSIATFKCKKTNVYQILYQKE